MGFVQDDSPRQSRQRCIQSTAEFVRYSRARGGDQQEWGQEKTPWTRPDRRSQLERQGQHPAKPFSGLTTPCRYFYSIKLLKMAMDRHASSFRKDIIMSADHSRPHQRVRPHITLTTSLFAQASTTTLRLIHTF